MKFKKTIIIFIIVLILILGVILIKNNYKTSKNGNNISNKSADEIENLILNIGSYEAKANITIKSNKNQNTYVVKQKYNKEGNLYRQEILEPSGIAGTLIQYDGKDLTIKNTNLNVKKIYENYSYICLLYTSELRRDIIIQMLKCDEELTKAAEAKFKSYEQEKKC